MISYGIRFREKNFATVWISNFARWCVFTECELRRGEGPYRRVHSRRVTTVYGTVWRANFTINSQRDAGRESQRPCVTSPSNIDLSATSSMLIPHSNSRSRCGARVRFARTGGRARMVHSMFALTLEILEFVELLVQSPRNVRDRVSQTIRWKIRHMTGLPTHLQGPPIQSFPPSPSCFHARASETPLQSPSRSTGTSSGPMMKGALRKALRLIGDA